MMRQRNLWRALSLSLVGALSLLAFSAVSAQAGKFKLTDPATGQTAELLALITGEQIGEGLLLVPGRNLTIKCTGGNLEPGAEIINGNEGLAKIEFTGCTTHEHKSPFGAIACKVDNPLATVKALPILHGGERYVLFEPDAPATLFTTVILLDASCPLPEENPVHGTVLALLDNNDTAKPELLFKHVPTSLEKSLGDVLKFGGFESTIEGTAYILAINAHKDFKIGIL
jgi:hypothetical protein